MQARLLGAVPAPGLDPCIDDENTHRRQGEAYQVEVPKNEFDLGMGSAFEGEFFDQELQEKANDAVVPWPPPAAKQYYGIPGGKRNSSPSRPPKNRESPPPSCRCATSPAAGSFRGGGMSRISFSATMTWAELETGSSSAAPWTKASTIIFNSDKETPFGVAPVVAKTAPVYFIRKPPTENRKLLSLLQKSYSMAKSTLLTCSLPGGSGWWW